MATYEKNRKPFWKRHIFGWILSILTIVCGLISYNIWLAFQGPVGAEIAVNQVSDSAGAFAAHQAVNYGGVVGIVITVITALLVILFLLPTARDAIKNLSKEDS